MDELNVGCVIMP